MDSKDCYEKEFDKLWDRLLRGKATAEQLSLFNVNSKSEQFKGIEKIIRGGNFKIIFN